MDCRAADTFPYCRAVQVSPAPCSRYLLLSIRGPHGLELPPKPGCCGWRGIPDRTFPADASAGLDLGEARAHCLLGFKGPPAFSNLKEVVPCLSQYELKDMAVKRGERVAFAFVQITSALVQKERNGDGRRKEGSSGVTV